MGRVYVVEDEQDIAELVRFNLALSGHEIQIFSSGEDGLAAIQKSKPELLVLDIMLPGLSGLEVCEQLKAQADFKDLPIIIMSAKGEEQDIVKGLELGADDYITKPFSTAVLKARVEAVLRRSRSTPVIDQDSVHIDGLAIHHGHREVMVEGKKIDLTQSEFDILYFLAMRPGWVYTRSQIVEAVHGANYAVTDRTIDFQMVGLRKKMGSKGELIETVRGVGYRFKNQA
ncbi:MAG: response regulator transcription factor [Bdellovibrionales bacterium]|nr:response regulator transcription factor [Bdellovibrionales bacterium]